MSKITLSAKWNDLKTRTISGAILAGVALLAFLLGPVPFGLLIAALVIAGLYELVMMARNCTARADIAVCAGYGVIVVLGGIGLFSLYNVIAPIFFLLIALLVIATDVAGYVGGKLIGGPKFWPAVSPNKTWAGIVSGWVAAAIIASIGAFPDLAWPIIGAVVISMLSQAGDMLQSALKRRLDVKDSSNLIPGHGGVLDRFDGLLLVGAVYAPIFLSL